MLRHAYALRSMLRHTYSQRHAHRYSLVLTETQGHAETHILTETCLCESLRVDTHTHCGVCGDTHRDTEKRILTETNSILRVSVSMRCACLCEYACLSAEIQGHAV